MEPDLHPQGRPAHAVEPRTTLTRAYGSQDAAHSQATASGRHQCGWKLALTDATSQHAFGASEPVRGRLYDDLIVRNGTAVDLASFARPFIEMELVFRLRSSIRPQGPLEAALDAVESVSIGLEVVDLGPPGDDPTLHDLVANNAYAGRIVLGNETSPSALRMGRTRATAQGLLLGSEFIALDPALLSQAPANLQWLANALWSANRQRLRAGDLVFSGSLTGMTPVTESTTARAVMPGLAELSAAVHRPSASADNVG